MRIAVVTASDMVAGVPMGGTIGYLQSILPHFRSQVVVFGFQAAERLEGPSVVPGTQIPFRAIFRATYPTRTPHRVKALLSYALRAEHVRRLRPDVLYVHSPEIAVPFLLPRSRIPLVYHQHGSASPVAFSSRRFARGPLVSSAFDEIFAVIYPRADWVVGIDRLCVAEAEAGGARGRVSLIMNAVDTRVFLPAAGQRVETRARMGLGEDERLLLFVGRLEGVKRVDCAIEALRLLRLAGHKCRLAIAGTGSLRSELERLATEAGVRGQVSFLGSVPHLELPALYVAADCVVLPSEIEGVPMSVLEALACGTPAVATSVGGTPDLVTSSLAGELIERPDPRLLMSALLRVLHTTRNPAEVAATVKSFDSRNVAAELELLFSRVVEARRQRTAAVGPGRSTS